MYVVSFVCCEADSSSANAIPGINEKIKVILKSNETNLFDNDTVYMLFLIYIGRQNTFWLFFSFESFISSKANYGRNHELVITTIFAFYKGNEIKTKNFFQLTIRVGT